MEATSQNNIDKMLHYLKEYSGRDLTIMEVCGSHTAAIAKSGIKDVISDRIHLVSGPGCPVCVTPSAYIDRLIELSFEPNTCVVTFGDMIRVPGSRRSLGQAKGEGANVLMVYSPIDTLKHALLHPEISYVFAAVGFETTTPIYALMLERIIREKIYNVRFLTALKTMPAAVAWLCENGAAIDAFIAPGHVCVITGSDAFLPIAKKYQIPFGVAGFEPEELITALYGILHMICEKSENTQVRNFYPSVVTNQGNTIAQEKVRTYFEPCDAVWRGMGTIKTSGIRLKAEYQKYDAGSATLTNDHKINAACCCDQILIGKMTPKQCPLFAKICNPQNPQGACMVSMEGSCYQAFVNR